MESEDANYKEGHEIFAMISCFALAWEFAELDLGDRSPATCFGILQRRQASRYDIPIAAEGRESVCLETELHLCGVSCLNSAMYELGFISMVRSVTLVNIRTKGSEDC